MAFDEQQRGKRVLSTAEIEASSTVADRFLTTAGLLSHGTLENKNNLDLACGTGQVTVGLYLHEHIRHCKIFGFDHSLQSLQVLANTLSNLSSTNIVYLSAQDVTRLAYADRMFDLVVGDAVLHHFVNFSETLEHVLRLLKPGGRAILAEPFAYGYLLAMTILKIATHEVKRTRAILPDMGMYDFIVDNIAYRARYYDDPSKLEGLTDKHLFREQHIIGLGNQLGFSVRFENYADDTYYDGFRRDILRTYNIANRNVADRADELYQVVRDYLKEALPNYFSHFRFIVMEKIVKTES
jgi:ubiquinone/menaquinone biosynthesis C-methylase UbiE